jgi:TolB-like protein
MTRVRSPNIAQLRRGAVVIAGGVRYDHGVKNFFSELQRRNVVKVGGAYLVLAWVIAQVSELALDSFEAPGWVMKTLLLLLALGFPLALLFAWAFELTPDGIKRDKDVDRSESAARPTGSKFGYVIIAAAVSAVGYFLWDTSDTAKEAAPADRESSVAVLPFVNMSADPAQEYFSDGITEEIINAVVKIPGLSVPARTSVFAFRDHRGDVREIGASLGVAHVLEGSVRSQGDLVRITAQLIKVDDGFHIWSETFDRKLENIFVVQEEIASAIAAALVGELGAKVNTVPNQTHNMAAYDTYLKGRVALRRRDWEAVALLEQATAADAEFAPAWAALAIAYQSITEDDRKAMETAQKALALDANNVDALNAMGGSLRRTRRWLEAEPYFDKALASDPNSAELLEDYAEFLSHVGRNEEALAFTRRGMEIDSRLLPLVFAHLDALGSNGLVEDAFELAQQVLEGEADNLTWLYWYMLPTLRSPALDPGLLTQEVPTESADEQPQWIVDLIEAAARVVKGSSDEALIDYLKGYYPLPDRLEEARGYDSALIARDALVNANQLDYIIEKDIWWARQADLVLHEYSWTPFYARLRQHPRYGEYLEHAGIVAYWDATEWPDWCERGADRVVRCR